MQKWKIKLLSPAKINLFLYIAGRNERGFHLLQSLFCLVPSIADKISIEINNSSEITVESNEAIQDNLVKKAAQVLLKNTPYQNIGMKFKLEKNIPIGAGLGGGSSNAASTLIALNILLELKLSTDELISISESIGDDIKFFLMQKNCVYYDGIKKHDVELNTTLNLLLVKPEFSLNTAVVYDIYRKNFPTSKLKTIVQKDKLLEYVFSGENQLYDIVSEMAPKICNVIYELQNQEGIITARMTGSGSTCFGIFQSASHSRRAMYIISKKYPEWFVHSCEFTI